MKYAFYGLGLGVAVGILIVCFHERYRAMPENAGMTCIHELKDFLGSMDVGVRRIGGDLIPDFADVSSHVDDFSQANDKSEVEINENGREGPFFISLQEQQLMAYRVGRIEGLLFAHGIGGTATEKTVANEGDNAADGSGNQMAPVNHESSPASWVVSGVLGSLVGVILVSLFNILEWVKDTNRIVRSLRR